MTTKSILTSLVRFKAQSDDEMLSALSAVPLADRGPEFSAALSVINHFHTVDRIFMANIQGQEHAYPRSWPDVVPPFDTLAAGVREVDEWYRHYIDEMSDADLDTAQAFRFTDGARGCMTRAEMIAHVVTHSGYHRGDVGRLVPAIERTAMRDIFTGFLHRTEPHRRDRMPHAR